jgi:phosphohistidine phosphatase
MKLHVIRHAEAVESSPTTPDEYRYLTCRGRTRFRRVAETLKKCGIDPDIIISSPLVRAVQTAEIIAENLRFSGELLIVPFLGDGFSFSLLRDYIELKGGVRELVLVGHEPDLGRLVGELLNKSACTVKKGGVVTLNLKFQQPDTVARFLWMVTGGGKLITDHTMALTRLTGCRDQTTED